MSSDSPADGEATQFGEPTKDPWKAFRGVLAGVLILEAIVVLLGLPIVAKLSGGVTWVSGGYLVGLALLMIAGGGLQRRPWAMPYNLALQVAFVAGWFAHPSIGVIGLIFAGVWGYLLWLRRDVQSRMKRGLLPGQRD